MNNTNKTIFVKNRFFNIINTMIFGIFTLMCIFPLYYIFVLTISDNKLAASGRLLLFPIGFHLDNYVQVVRLRGIGQAALISVIKTTIGTALTLIGSSFTGYLFSKPIMWYRKFFYRFLIITMYFNAGLIPWYIMMKNLHLTDNFLAYILPYIILPFYIILFKTYIEGLPASLEESASLDGAGYLTLYSRIILPVSKPILATIVVFESVNQWNNFTDNLFLMKSQSLYCLQYILYLYLNEVEGLANTIRQGGFNSGIVSSIAITPTAIRMTIAMIVIFPILLIYPFMQRYFVKGIIIGAIKG